ncbi:MAG: M15 family metallopeptidase, partial [Thermodesulfobacteriota bacterium]
RYTERAANEHEALSERIREEGGEFDFRTEKNIRTLLLTAQREARAYMNRVLDAGINVKIISGTRTYAEQNGLFRRGRFGNPGPKVTNARGGGSNHNFGIAWDIGIFTGAGGYVTEGAAYDRAAKAGAADSLEWGGGWTSFVDRPHYQLNVGLPMKTIRARFEAGEKIVANT